MERAQLFRALPAVDEILRRPAVLALEAAHGRPVVTEAVRRVLEAARTRIAEGEVDAPEAVAALVSDTAVSAEVRGRLTPALRRVVNATGVVLHTNLGRAPLSADARAAAADASAYASLEIDLAEGRRGRREAGVGRLVSEVLGCEAATVVNNCAAAVMIVLEALAAGREVVVSRGELVEIGGGFRIPEVLAQSGCRLVEVGTTNRTRVGDYARAAGPETGALLKVHRSNFAVQGFTEEASVAELAALAHEIGVPLVHDLGSGLLDPGLAGGLLAGETTPRASLEAGADLVCFSGDKLLGGPQAGIVAGRRVHVEAVARHPLMRALRCDKLVLAALEATLRAYRDGRADEVPLVAMLRATVPDLAALAEAVLRRLAEAGVGARLVEEEDAVGGGSAPLVRMPGVAVEVEAEDADALAARLRTGRPAVVGVVREGRVRLHLRTVPPDAVEDLAEAVVAAAT